MMYNLSLNGFLNINLIFLKLQQGGFHWEKLKKGPLPKGF